MALTMTKEEREAFLADIHVAVISVAEDGHGPLVVPLWYSYEPGGEVRIVTGRAVRKGKLLERAGRFSLCVQTETLPYKYVSVEGPIVAIEAADLRAAGRSPCALRRSEISATGERVRIFHTLRDTTPHTTPSKLTLFTQPALALFGPLLGATSWVIPG
jgi:nitroimidazol reductase NimA-like FMN-containing flavoprotein (pyridoxamine 5'-phosphate oxidase superfamily)